MEKKVVILIAEDDTGHFILVKKNLWRSCTHSDILHFRDGQEILDFLSMSDSDSKRLPANRYVLVLDIRMPEVDGVDVLRRIKADEELRKIPVIILTTTADAEEVRRCYEIGCGSYVVKPANYNDFMTCVEHLGAFLSLPEIEIPMIGRPDEIRDISK